MGFTIIQNINKHNITIVESYYTYKVLYILPYAIVSGLPITLTGINIQYINNHYKVNLTNDTDIQLLKEIDEYIINIIPNYISCLKNDTTGYYILFKQNSILDSILKSYKTMSDITIHLFKIKKYAYHSYPLVYIL
jgi:hypothetical protein